LPRGADLWKIASQQSCKNPHVCQDTTIRPHVFSQHVACPARCFHVVCWPHPPLLLDLQAAKCIFRVFGDSHPASKGRPRAAKPAVDVTYAVLLTCTVLLKMVLLPDPKASAASSRCADLLLNSKHESLKDT